MKSLERKLSPRPGKFSLLKILPLLPAAYFLPLISCHAEVRIETAVSSSSVAVGEEFTLDVIISDADGKISPPRFPALDGINSYSQGRSQEITIHNHVIV